MTKNTLLKTLASLVIITWTSIYALNSETVVDYVFQIGWDNPPEYFDYKNAPISVDRVVEANEWKELKMPLQIEQASGLSVSWNQFLFTTDKAEVVRAHRDDNHQLIYDATLDILHLPLLLKQGHMEAATFWSNYNTAYAIGWNALYTIDISDKQMSIVSERALSLSTQVPGELIEVQAMVYDTQWESIYVGYSPDDGEGIYIAEISTDGTFKRQVPVFHDTHPQSTDLIRAFPWFIASGLSMHQGQLVVLSDQHSSLLWIDTQTGEIQELWWLAEQHDLTGFSIYDGMLYVTQDHEYYQDIPALRVLDISEL